MHRWLVGLLLLAGCDDGGGKDTGDAAACGSTMSFVYGSVTGSSASDKGLVVAATSASGERVEADWYGEQGGAVAYELNLAPGSWTIQADTGACTGDAVTRETQACEEYEVDLTVSCR